MSSHSSGRLLLRSYWRQYAGTCSTPTTAANTSRHSNSGFAAMMAAAFAGLSSAGYHHDDSRRVNNSEMHVTKLDAGQSSLSRSSQNHHRQLHATANPHTLFVWDFDWTVVNCNSDEYIPAQFIQDEEELKQKFRDLYASTNGDWHACVEGVVQHAIHAKGATPASLLQAAEQMPYLEGVKQALDMIDHNNINNLQGQEEKKENDSPTTATTSQMILSDGNTLFINAFLKRHGLVQYFDWFGVVSNKGEFTTLDPIPNSSSSSTSDGDERQRHPRLKVTHQSLQYGGHTCSRCSSNLCKTQALQRTLQEKVLDQTSTLSAVAGESVDPKQRRIKQIIYVGDGGNDACPALNVLNENDVLLARVGGKRTFANTRHGSETDSEANTPDDKHDGMPDNESPPISSFGIIPTLERVKEEHGITPKCQVLTWSTGEELKAHVQRLLFEVAYE